MPVVATAFDDTFASLYQELRVIARSRVSRHGTNPTVEATALVNDCYIKLKKNPNLEVANRLEFLSYASRAMRSIIVDMAREEMAQRRGSDITVLTLDTALAESLPAHANNVEQVDQALRELEAMDAKLARMVELRFFGGLTIEEIAEIEQVNERTIRRDWTKAKALLQALLEQ
jgi:RNA polymerase sigma factor (TIGR02999 family)